MKVKITGMKYFIGRVKDSDIDSGRVFAECVLDDSRNEADKSFAKGYFTEEFRVPSSIVKSLQHLPVPFDAELDIRRVGNGKEAKEKVVGVKPVGIAKAA